jgi:uncharacterized membrane protein
LSLKDLPPEKKKIVKELARLRLSAIFFAAAFVATIFTITEENDILLHALDDYTIVTLSIVALVIILVLRKKRSFENLRMQNNLLVVISAVLVLFVLFAISQEIGDSSDFGDEPGQLIFLIVLVVNRFT